MALYVLRGVFCTHKKTVGKFRTVLRGYAHGRLNLFSGGVIININHRGGVLTAEGGMTNRESSIVPSEGGIMPFVGCIQSSEAVIRGAFGVLDGVLGTPPGRESTCPACAAGAPISIGEGLPAPAAPLWIRPCNEFRKCH